MDFSSFCFHFCSLNCSVLAFSPPTLSLACPISFSRQTIPVSFHWRVWKNYIFTCRWGQKTAPTFRPLTFTVPSSQSRHLICSRTSTCGRRSLRAPREKVMWFKNCGMKTNSAALSVGALVPSTSTSPSPPRSPAYQLQSPGSPSQSLGGSWLWKNIRWDNVFKRFTFRKSVFLINIRWAILP